MLMLSWRSVLKRFESVPVTNLIHFPTGNLWSAKFCGYSKTRYESENIVPSQLNWFTERWFDLLMRRQVSAQDTGRRELIHAHNTQHCGLTECDLVGKCDSSDSGKDVKTIKTQPGRNLATHRYMARRWQVGGWVQVGMHGYHSPHMSGSKCQSSLRLGSGRLSVHHPEETRGDRLPEPQSLLRVEVNILPRNELCTDVDISGGDEGATSLLVLGGTRFRASVGHR